MKAPESAGSTGGMGGMLLGYARVLKGDEQNIGLRARAPGAAGCRKPFEEVASGGRWDRLELHRMLDKSRERDTVVVCNLDRLSRSRKDVLHIMEEISSGGAGFQAVTENIDTATPADRMSMKMVGSLAEFERAVIRERISAGLVVAWAEGRVSSRRKKLDAAKRGKIAESPSPAASATPTWAASRTSASNGVVDCRGAPKNRDRTEVNKWGLVLP